MAQNNKKSKGAKSPKKAHASSGKHSAQNTKNTQGEGSSKGNQQKTWQVVARLVIVGLLVFSLAASLFFGILSSAYSLPVSSQGQTVSQIEPAPPYVPSSFNALQPGDRIDGRSAEDYTAATSDLPNVVSPIAMLSTKDGRILFERNIDEQVPMASTTKMMTAIIALETLSLDAPLTVTYGAANTDGTDSGLKEGMVLTLHETLYALLIPSGNDAAVVIAENIAGMQSRFVQLMNEKAAELGMTSTHYVDASGLSYAKFDESGNPVELHQTTARDYLTLTRYCMENQIFREIVGTHYYELDIAGTLIKLEPTDLLPNFLTVGEAIGIKTGYTDEAGYCFVGAANLTGVELYTVVFNAPTGDQRFIDTAALMEWGFRHFRTIELINTTQQVAEVALLSWIDKTVPVFVPSVVHVEIFDLNGTIEQEITINDITGEVTKGLVCGEIVWSLGGEVIMTSEVVATQAVAAPGFFEGIGISWQRFWGGFSGESQNAETTILLKHELAIPAPIEQQIAA